MLMAGGTDTTAGTPAQRKVRDELSIHVGSETLLNDLDTGKLYGYLQALSRRRSGSTRPVRFLQPEG